MSLLTRKRRAAPSFLDPLGGRTTYVVGLGALNSALTIGNSAQRESSVVSKRHSTEEIHGGGRSSSADA